MNRPVALQNGVIAPQLWQPHLGKCGERCEEQKGREE
jgi:hypothetical protein